MCIKIWTTSWNYFSFKSILTSKVKIVIKTSIFPIFSYCLSLDPNMVYFWIFRLKLVNSSTDFTITIFFWLIESFDTHHPLSHILTKNNCTSFSWLTELGGQKPCFSCAILTCEKKTSFFEDVFLKGVTGNVWQLNWECSIVEKLFRIYLRHKKRFKDLSLSAKSMFKVVLLGEYRRKVRV